MMINGMSDYLDPNNEELLKDFFSEAQMQVETLEQNILVLENEGGNKDAVDEIFRAAHTLKGGSATVEMMELSHFTHMVEDVLDAIRSDRLAVNEDVVDTLLAAIDIIKAMLEQRMNGAVYQEDTSQMESRLEAMIPEAERGKKGGAKAKAAPAAPPPAPVPAPPKPAAAAAGLSEAEIRELKETVSNGAPIYRVTVEFDESSLMNTVGGIQCYAALKGSGSILKTNPEFERLYEDTFFSTVDYYIATSKTPAELERQVTIPDVTLSCAVKTLDELAAQAPARGLLAAAEAQVSAAPPSAPPP
ncbi:MAG: Hpt domain-containing protein, partial [Treponema sp.]|nr:Hpt domain-containing protein [Treponema sp.]